MEAKKTASQILEERARERIESLRIIIQKHKDTIESLGKEEMRLFAEWDQLLEQQKEIENRMEAKKKQMQEIVSSQQSIERTVEAILEPAKEVETLKEPAPEEPAVTPPDAIEQLKPAEPVVETPAEESKPEAPVVEIVPEIAPAEVVEVKTEEPKRPTRRNTRSTRQ